MSKYITNDEDNRKLEEQEKERQFVGGSGSTGPDNIIHEAKDADDPLLAKPYVPEAAKGVLSDLQYPKEDERLPFMTIKEGMEAITDKLNVEEPRLPLRGRDMTKPPLVHTTVKEKK